MSFVLAVKRQFKLLFAARDFGTTVAFDVTLLTSTSASTAKRLQSVSLLQSLWP